MANKERVCERARLRALGLGWAPSAIHTSIPVTAVQHTTVRWHGVCPAVEIEQCIASIPCIFHTHSVRQTPPNLPASHGPITHHAPIINPTPVCWCIQVRMHAVQIAPLLPQTHHHAPTE